MEDSRSMKAPLAPPPPPRRRKAHTRGSGRVLGFDADDDDWLLGEGPPVNVHPKKMKITCCPDVTTASSEATTTALVVETGTTAAEATEPKSTERPAVEPAAAVELASKSVVTPPRDPLANYTPLSTRAIDSQDEDWMMQSLVPAEACE